MSYEKDEILSLPDKYSPLGAWAYFAYSILFTIPVIGFICLVVFALGGDNINRRNFARSYFCGFILAIILIAFMIVLVALYGADFLEYLEQYMQQYPYQ